MIGASKLTSEDIKCMRHLFENTDLSDYKIAKIFNVSRPHIWKIRNNHRWNLAEKSFLMKDDISQMELGHQPVWWNDYVEKYIELKIQEMIELNK